MVRNSSFRADSKVTFQPFTSGLARCGTTIAFVAVALLAGCGSSKGETIGIGGNDSTGAGGEGGQTTVGGETDGSTLPTDPTTTPVDNPKTTPTDPTKPATDPTKPATDPTKPATDPTTNPTNPETSPDADMPPESDDCVHVVVTPVADAGVVDAAEDVVESPFGNGKPAKPEAGAAKPDAGQTSKGLDKKNWKPIEVSGFYDGGDYMPPENAIDGDRKTRWSTGIPQTDSPKPNERQRIQIDMGSRQRICRLVIDSVSDETKDDWSRKIDVYLSDDPSPTEPVYSGDGQGVTEIKFEKAKRGRYLGIVNRATSGSWWSIFEIDAYR